MKSTPKAMIYDEVTEQRYPEDEYHKIVEARKKRQAILGGVEDTHRQNAVEQVMERFMSSECDHNPGRTCEQVMGNGNGHCCREYTTLQDRKMRY